MVSALRFAALVCVLFAGLACRAEADERLKLHEVEAFLAREGGKATLEKYFCGEHEGAAYAAISNGSRRWAALAVKMLEFADAGCAESLTASLGKAMQRSPSNILPYVGTQVVNDQGTAFTLDTGICLPFISDELPMSEALRQVRASREAISRVRDKKLADQRKTCLEFIDRLERKMTAKQAGDSRVPEGLRP